MFSVDDPTSFKEVTVMYNRIMRVFKPHLEGLGDPPLLPFARMRKTTHSIETPISKFPFPVVIVGNKADLGPQQRRIEIVSGLKLCDCLQCATYMEASSIYGKGVNEIILELTKFVINFKKHYWEVTKSTKPIPRRNSSSTPSTPKSRLGFVRSLLFMLVFESFIIRSFTSPSLSLSLKKNPKILFEACSQEDEEK